MDVGVGKKELLYPMGCASRKNFGKHWTKASQVWEQVGFLPLVDFEILHFPFKFLTKNVVFLLSSGYNQISSLFLPPGKIVLATLGKIHYCLLWKKSFRRPWLKPWLDSVAKPSSWVAKFLSLEGQICTRKIAFVHAISTPFQKTFRRVKNVHTNFFHH